MITYCGMNLKVRLNIWRPMVSNRYQILEEIGSGGIAKVLKAFDLFTQRGVAIKILLSNESEHVERFKNEFLLLRKLHHPNIVKVYDFGFSNVGQPYFSMEHIEGRDWNTSLRPPDYRKFWHIAFQICRTLDFLHSKRIVHGDVKPSNILIANSPDGELTIKFTDFGFAEYGNTQESPRLKGSFPYLAPEIIRGEKHTPQADLYSVGILFYEILFGKPPFDEQDPMDLARSHLEKDVVIPKEPPVPKELKNLILKLLEKDPLDRFFSAKDILDQIRRISGMAPDNLESLLARTLINSADFVGRETEFRVVREALTHSADTANRFVLVTGEPGIGKASLLSEFVAWAQLHGFSALKVSLKETKAFEALQDRTLPFSESMSHSSVLVFEHLELADDSFFSFLSDFVSNMQRKQIQFCFTLTNELCSPEENRRAEEIAKRIRSICGDSIISMRLDRLTQVEIESLLCSMFDLRERAEKIAPLVYRETGGNPLLTRQLMETSAEEGGILRKNGKWRIERENILKSKIPQDVRDVIKRRLSGLRPDSVELLTCASVWGSEIETEELTQLSGFDRRSILTSLNEIFSQGLMQQSPTPDKRRFRFVNNLTRRFIWNQIDTEKGKNLHQKAGEILEKKGLHREANAYELANHFYQAGDAKRALKFSLLAAQQAVRKCEHYQAIAQYTYALEIYDQVPTLSSKSKEDILENLADLFDLIGEPGKSLSIYEEALQIWNSKTSNHERPAAIYRKMGKIFEKMNEHDKALEFLEKSLQNFKTMSSLKHYSRTLVNLGWVHLKKSEYERAIGRFGEALDVLQEDVTSKERGFALSGLGSTHWALGDYSQASWYHRESLEVFRQIGDTKKVAECYGNLAIISRSRGELRQAIEYFRKCVDLLETVQDHYRLSILYNNLSLAHLDLDHWDEALHCLSKACEFQEKVSDPVGLGLSYNNIGLINLRKGGLCRALEYFKNAIVQFQTAQHRSGLALVYYNLGDLYTHREEFNQALSYLNKSLRIREELGEEAGMADCFALLGKAFLQQSKSNQAAQNFLQAQNLYQKQKNKKAQAEVLLSRAELYLKIGEPVRAETRLTQAQQLLQQFDSKSLWAYSQRVRATFMRSMGDLHDSLECLSGSSKTFREIDAKFELARTYLEIGKTKLELKRYKEAKRFLRESLNVFEREKAETKKKEVESLLGQINDLTALENERITTFYQLAELLNNIWDTDELLSKSLELTIQLLNAERGAIILYSDKDQSFEVKVSRGIEQETSQDAIAISRQVLTDVVKSDSPLVIEDTRKDPRFTKSRSVIMYNILSVLCVPLKTKDRLIGTVYLDHRGLPAVFSREDADFLKAFANLIATAIEKSELYVRANEEIFQLKEVLHRTYEYPEIIGKSMKMQEVFNTVEKVASSKTGVLILGENGTGKEVIANLIHNRSPRRDGPFIKVNCAALPETLLESELFGIEQKTATGVGFRKGKFELADSGTIFLDEIGDMSLSVQAKVLRAIEEKEFERVGGQRSIKVDVRVISATNMDLHKKIEEGSFRKDLYFRLNPIVVTIPPLRERKEDIPFLIEYFLRKFSEENSNSVKVTKRIIDALREYSWPGNVRELEHLIESATLLSEDGSFPEKLLPKEARKTKTMISLDKYGKLEEVMSFVEKKKILYSLDKNRWNQSKAAKELGISEPTLRRRIKEYKIKKPKKIQSS